MMASIATVVTRGYGTFGSVNLLPTLGYGIGAAVVVVAGNAGWFAGQVHVPGFREGQVRPPDFVAGEAKALGFVLGGSDT